jgi:4-azaleucine resistance transporter AzlC
LSPGVREGIKAGLPFGVAAVLLGASFGVLARPVFGVAGAIVMSAIVFAGAAQFGATAVLAAGGGALAAIVAGVLLNARFLPMGIAVASSLAGGAPRRALEGQAINDASWAIAHQGGGRFDRDQLLGATVPQYPGWVLGTVLGVFAGDVVGDTDRLGLDAIFPAFFLALLVAEMRDRRSTVVALLGAAVALVLIPLVPAGLPVVAASLVALLGLRRP